jgi:hypothetical protein
MMVMEYCEAAVESASRFTLDGSPELEGRLAETCDLVRQGVRSLVSPERLEGVLLGGGYGRGEGGVLETDAGDQPYNDLEFYVFIKGSTLLNQRRYGHALAELGERLSPAAGLEVEFKILSLDQLRRSPVNMFYYDLVMGHRWIVGEEGLLAGCEHHRRAEDIPAAEAARLLMNRCAGLLFAEKRLRLAHFTPDDADFVGRNHAKARLAFGDAFLVMQHQYHWSCRERLRRFRRLALECRADWVHGLADLHEQGVEFKLRPFRSTKSQQDLRRQQDELVYGGFRRWQFLELWRLNTPFLSARSYAQSSLNKCPETNPLRNCLVNLKNFGARALGPGLLRYPRQRLFHALVLLLWEPDTVNDPALLALAQRELNSRATTFPELVRAFNDLWHRFN